MPLHQTNNEAVDVAAQNLEVNQIWQLFDSFDIFSADPTEETKICQEKLCPLIFFGTTLVLSPSADIRPLSAGDKNLSQEKVKLVWVNEEFE